MARVAAYGQKHLKTQRKQEKNKKHVEDEGEIRKGEGKEGYLLLSRD
jgi:hypothetical protein